MEEQRPPAQEQPRSPGERVREFVGRLVEDWRPPSEQQVLQWIRIALAVGFVILIVLLILWVIGLLFGITLLKLLKILAVPITLGAAVPLLNWLQKKRELDVEHQRAQDEALQAYLDQMSQLLADKERPLHRAQPGDNLSTVARARTLTVLARLETDRKRSVAQFLYESGLINKNTLVVRLHGANLSEANLWGANLSEAYLSGANLSEAYLSEADLWGADLRHANLSYADLRHTYLSHANLSNADLSNADLSNADLSLTDLSLTDLRGANLWGASLWGADLGGADLRGADLSGAGGLTNEDLERKAFEARRLISTLEDATMPNGQKYEDWLKDKENPGRDLT